MSEENVEIVRGCYEAFARGDYSILEEVCDPDIVIDFSRNVINPDVYPGYEGVRAFGKNVEEVWAQFDVEPQELIDGGDHVVADIRVSARGAGSGVPVEGRAVDVWTFRAGKVIELRGGHRDREEALKAAGLSE
ncbi:MAG: nuclear transport factor 2 family protein [Solirubrobacterales bacterium]